MVKRRVFGFAGLAVLAGCLLILGFRLVADPDAGADAGPQMEPDKVPEAVSPERPSRSAPTVALPPLELPLAHALPTLREQAAAGVPAAACRLAAEYQFCSSLAQRREEMADWLGERQLAFELVTSAGKDTRNVDTFQRTFEEQLALREGRLAAHERRCEGVPLPDEAGLLRHWRQAALLGDPTAMRYYASGSAFRWSNVLAAPDVQVAYRNEAASMAWALARQGDLLMTLRLANATSSSTRFRPGLLDEVIEDDPALALALYRRVLSALKAEDSPDAIRLINQIRRRIDLVRQIATPAQVQDARRRSQELEAWEPLSRAGLGAGTHVNGGRLPANPAACQFAGTTGSRPPG